MNANCSSQPTVKTYGTKTIISVCGWGYPGLSVHQHFAGLPAGADISHGICPKCADAMRAEMAPVIARRREQALALA